MWTISSGEGKGERIRPLVSKSAITGRWKGVLCLCLFLGEKIEAIRRTEMPSSVSFLSLSVREHLMEAKKQDNESFSATYPSKSGAHQFPRIPRERSVVLLQRGHRAVPLIRHSLVFVMTAVTTSSAPHTHLSYQPACMV